jgi:hypothetical protein
VTAPAPYMRPPAGTRRADGMPPCRERYALNQSTPAGMLPCQKLCILCGRVTARRDHDDMPWCGGELPTVPIGATA